MAYLTPTSKASGNDIPVWHEDIITLPGGFALDTTGLTKGNVLKAGSLISYDEATRKAKKGVDTDTYLALTKNEIVIDDDAPVTAVVGGIVYENRIDVVSATAKSKMPNIIFSKSF